MKLTLLDMTQSILSSLSSDEVNSISDTTESLQVAEIIRQTYFNMISRVGITDHNQLIQLDPSIDVTIPVLMYIPEGIGSLTWLKYFNNNVNNSSSTGDHDINTDIIPANTWSTTSITSNTIALGTQTFTVSSSSLDVLDGQTVIAESGTSSMTGTLTSYIGTTLILDITSIIGSGTFSSWVISSNDDANVVPGYEYVTILPVRQFIDMVNGFNPSETDVSSFTFNDTSNSYPGAFTFYYKNDKTPSYCTILSNYYVIFDSYDESVDSTLQSSKTLAEGSVIPTFTMSDSFTPNLSEEQFPLLLNEAKSLAFFELKQMVHQKAEQEAKRGWSKVQKSKNIIDRPSSFDALPNFGRRSRYHYMRTFNDSFSQN